MARRTSLQCWPSWMPRPKGNNMNRPTDQSVLKTIQELAAEEHHIYEQEAFTDAEKKRLARINLELDQCWDLLRQRQALRDAGRDPKQARTRAADVVERYEG